MANMIYADVTFFGKKELISELYNAFETDLRNDHFGDFYAPLAKSYGLDEDVEGGWLTCLDEIIKEESETETSFSCQMEYKWCPQTELFKKICEHYNNEIQFVYICEGNGIYVNTDKEGRYYTDRYFIDWNEDGNKNADSCFLENWEQVVETIKERFPKISKVHLDHYTKSLNTVLSELLDKEDVECEFRVYKYMEEFVY